VPDTECRVVDVGTKRELLAGELGEIWVRGPQVMRGYLNNPEVTRRVLDAEHWLHTGDIGYADADGYIYVLDRANDLVKFRGLQYRDDELLLSVVETGGDAVMTGGGCGSSRCCSTACASPSWASTRTARSRSGTTGRSRYSAMRPRRRSGGPSRP
jgi:hypothetical protein